jgi:hypothetical protein
MSLIIDSMNTENNASAVKPNAGFHSRFDSQTILPALEEMGFPGHETTLRCLRWPPRDLVNLAKDPGATPIGASFNLLNSCIGWCGNDNRTVGIHVNPEIAPLGASNRRENTTIAKSDFDCQRISGHSVY